MAIMELYSANYRKFHTLLPFPRECTNDLCLTSTEDPNPIYVEHIRHERYTSHCTLSYKFDRHTPETLPNAKLKLYHDSHQLEVLAVANHHHLKSFLTLTRHQGQKNLNARWHLNNFLHLWLEYCHAKKYRSIC
jgi:uncharacterized protein YqiB (DUF1249 family)